MTNFTPREKILSILLVVITASFGVYVWLNRQSPTNFQIQDQTDTLGQQKSVTSPTVTPTSMRSSQSITNPSGSAFPPPAGMGSLPPGNPPSQPPASTPAPSVSPFSQPPPGNQPGSSPAPTGIALQSPRTMMPGNQPGQLPNTQPMNQPKTNPKTSPGKILVIDPSILWFTFGLVLLLALLITAWFLYQRGHLVHSKSAPNLDSYKPPEVNSEGNSKEGE